MKEVYLTPGPSALYPGVEMHMKNAVLNGICSISHRGAEFKEVMKCTTDRLRKLFSLDDSIHAFFLGSATEAMERIVENIVEKKSVHFVNGSFSRRFFKCAVELQKEPVKHEVSLGGGFGDSSPDATGAELICFTQNETSTGVQTPEGVIRAYRKKYPDALIALDMVSSVPYYAPDFSVVDCAFFSVQKGFGLPSGLGVLFVNERCIEKARNLAEKGVSIGTYHNFLSLVEKSVKNQTPETPNILGIYLLGQVCGDFLKKGLSVIRQETEGKAKLVYEHFDSSEKHSCFVKEPLLRSKTTIVINAPDGSLELIARLKEKGLIIGAGYGEMREKQIRIANFPAHSFEDVKRALGCLGL